MRHGEARQHRLETLANRPGPASSDESGEGARRMGAATAGEDQKPAFSVRWGKLDPSLSPQAVAGWSLHIAQRIRRAEDSQMWESVAVYCTEESDGAVCVRMWVQAPGWTAPMQIAATCSRPDDPECLTPMGCNLDHVEIGK